ncbi:MAG TPA: DUF4350 domain-containing protein [Candidatus Lokiarchaeia archaeon]|nr:DUF4350 domain-containing protein [Candidatus Lokiarchaeia archaeon]
MKIPRKAAAMVLLALFFAPLLFGDVPTGASENTPKINPSDKMSPALLAIAKQGTNCWVDIIIIFEKNAGPNADALLAYYAALGMLEVKTRYTIIPGCLARVRSSILFDLAESPYVASLWEDGTSQSENINYQPLVAQIAGNFTNFTEEIHATDFYNASMPGGNTNGSSAVIAVLDTGVDITGEVQTGGDLAYFGNDTSATNTKFIGAVSMCPDDTLYYSDFTGRGTFNAGVACGTGRWNASYQGVAPGAYYLAVKVFDPLGITYWSFVISGIEWAISHGADIILFGGSIPGLYLDPMSLAFDAASDEGVFCVVPAGDDGPSFMSIDSPGQAMKAICVGAYNSSSGQVASFSSRGPSFDFRTGPDVIAPGVDLISTRAKILATSNGTVGAVSAFNFAGTNIGGIQIPGYNFAGFSGITLPNGSLPTPNYGTPVGDNYTMASGTAAAAAVVAGAIALLIQVFPSVTPELMKIALMRTAHPITGNENVEGAGLIDVYAAYLYLQQYLEMSSIYKFPVTAPVLYPGIVESVDSQNYSSVYNSTPGWQYWDSAMLLSTQAMMTAAVVMNASDFNFTMVDLPLNQFGVLYNYPVESSSGTGLLGEINLNDLLPSPDNNSFHWLSEFQVLRELHLAMDQPMGSEQYLRYVGALEYGPLMVILVVETYEYTTSQILPLPAPPTPTNRVNAYKLNFHFINTGTEPIYNLTFYSYFKADMFLNVSTSTSSLASYSNAQQILPLSPNKVVKHDNATDMLYVDDLDSDPTFVSNYGEIWGTMGFNSTDHPNCSWEIANGVNLLLDITLNHTVLTNTSNYVQGVDDPGWAASWPISSDLLPNQTEAFTGVFGLGIGKDNDTALAVLKDQMSRITSNVTAYNVTDMVILDDTTARIGYLNEIYHTSARFVNVGSVPVQQTNLLFFTNRTLTTGQTEGSFIDTPVTNLVPFQVVTVSADWQPIKEGVYSCAWVAADITALYGNANETTLLNNYLARNVFIISEDAYNSFADAVMYVTPAKMPNDPFALQNPGDFGVCNITIISVQRQDVLQIGYEGQAKNIFFFNQTTVNVTDGYGNLVGAVLVPLIGASPFMQGNLTFFRGSGPVIDRLPIQFFVTGNRGRILFDFVHNYLNIVVTNTTIDLGWDRRLYSTYGTFFNVRQVWANLGNKGASTVTLVPYITLNLTDYGFDISMLNQSAAIAALLQKFLGPYSLSSNIITTNTTNHDILQLFDVLVICDPILGFTPQEITDITNWVDAGGDLLVWARNASYCNVTAVNTLLNQFNLQIAANNSGPVLLVPDNRTDHPIFTGVGNILLQDPVNFTQTQNNTSADSQVLNAPGASTAPIAVAQRGLGKIVAVGDTLCFDADHLADANNTQFAAQIVNWFFERQFTWNLTTTPAQPVVINLGQQAYFNLEAVGPYAPNATQKVIYLMGAANAQGDTVPINLFGFNLPVFPLFRSDGSNFVGHFDSLWDNSSGWYYVTLYEDSAAFPSETFIIPILVLYAPPEPAPIIYQFPGPAYPHIYDIIGILGIVLMSAFLWLYRNEKWKTRLRVTILKDETLYEAQSRINELKALFKQLNRGLDSDVDALEKIRLLLGSQKRLSKTLRDFKKFGDRIGEYYD